MNKSLSEEHKRKISKKLKGRIFSEEHKKKLRKPKSEEHKRKISEANKNKVVSLEVRKKISKSHIGKYPTIETKQKMSKSHIGKHHISEEAKRKLSEINLGENNPNYGNHHTEEIKRIISEANKGDKNPSKRLEVRKKLSESLSGENNPAWKGGKSFEPYCPKFNNRKKEEIRNEYDRKCYLCGIVEIEQIKNQIENNKRPCKLHIHHIDDDKQQGCNGKEWKLVPLCRNCHAKQRKN